MSPRCANQRKLCRQHKLPFGVKLEINNSIECLGVPFLPILQNRLMTWQHCQKLRPVLIHSRWLFDGSCKSPSEELGYWMIWGGKSNFENLQTVLSALAQRDYGEFAAPRILGAWQFFCDAIRHHPSLGYYVGPYYIGPGQPLVIDVDGLPDPAEIGPHGPICSVDYTQSIRKLDPVFFGSFYWHSESESSDTQNATTKTIPLFYYQPAFRALVRKKGATFEDVALDELRTLASVWQKGVRELEKAQKLVPTQCHERFQQQMILARHLLYTWQSAANVEEFLRLRDTIVEFSQNFYFRQACARQNLRDLDRLEAIVCEEMSIAKKDLKLIKKTDFLDLSLRLDMGTASLKDILTAKIKQVDHVLKYELPKWRDKLLSW